MHRTKDQWAAIVPDAFLGGSIAQARNVIEMAQQDIASLYHRLDALESLAERYPLTPEDAAAGGGYNPHND